MAKGFIFLRDALSIMAQRDSAGDLIPFSLTHITCDMREDTGGRRVTRGNVTLAGGPFGKKVSARNANHYMNGTRNIMVPGKQRPITIHNVLITEFNGERVVI